ncbi:MAG: FAD-dependent oxidoreductase [Chloroflexi bacterium]|nr:FAD-dependent oxidoreductase [Chloroflexota bacterium]
MALRVISTYEVVVVGGGPAGIMAAIAAGRNGARTLLVERLGFLGGEPIGGLILHGFHNQRGEIVVRGIPAELVERLRAQGAAVGRVQMVNHPTFTAAISVDHEALKYAAMEMVLESGAEILFHSVLTDSIVEGSAVRGVMVHNKSGHQAILAQTVVDATGDGDVAVHAGAPFEKGRPQDGLMQPMTLLVTIAGVDLERVREVMGEPYGRAVDAVPGEEPGQIMWFGATLEPWAAEAASENLFPQVKDKRTIRFWGNAFRPGEANLNATFINQVDGTDVLDLTRAEIECRRQAFQLVAFLKKHVPGFEHATIVRTAPHIGIRETRRIIGDYCLTYADFLTEARFPDAIARCGYFADIHNPKPTGDLLVPPMGNLSKTRGDFDIPYRSLLPHGIEHLLVAGRCISASPEAMASVRVTGPVMAMGQAAGTAAALAVRAGVPPRALPVKHLQECLAEQGADLGRHAVSAIEVPAV